MLQHDQLAEQVSAHRQQLQELEEIQQTLNQGLEQRNPYSALSYDSLRCRFDQLQIEGLEERQERLRAEMQSQQHNEQLRLQFAEGANK